MPELTVRKVTRRAGKIYVRWSDKTEQEFDSLAQVREAVRNVLQDGGLRDIMRTLLLASVMKNSTDGSLLQSLEGKTIRMELAPSLTIGVT
jgi:hypothetical protein